MAYLLTSGIFVLLKSKKDRMHFIPGKALKLLKERNEPFLSLIEHGSLRLEISCLCLPVLSIDSLILR
jgi:hypothetical protein